MRTLPSGTVTLLFTDIEGSTRLLQELGEERFNAALGEHRRALREAFAAHEGVELRTEGDSFFAAFASAREAVAAAAQAQRALASCPLRVRIGIHTGEPLPVEHEDGYVGVDVHRAARICAAGHGGQVLLSQATRDLLDPSVELRDLGEHGLKDLLQPELLYQLVVEGLPLEFPALKTLGNRPTNLPVQPNALIGREAVVADVVALLRDETVRLLTLTGTGGIGKTRLALQVGAEVLDDFESGVFFVSLAPIRDPALVIPMIAQALGLREVPGDQLVATLVAYLEQKRMLLVLDNFEHVVSAAPDISVLLGRCARLSILVTSRERLKLAGERVYPVPALLLPEEQAAGLLALVANEAVALFAARAESATGAFVLTDENAAAVAAICRALDGLPLAIELAAARVASLPPAALLARLDQRLKLLTSGARDADERQRTLRTAIEWSYGLLSKPEKLLFVRLSVFVGGCRLEAADAVCNPDGDLGIDVLDGLSALFEKSLLRQGEDPDGEPRFWMLETIREYAAEAVPAQDAACRTHDEFMSYFGALADAAESQLRGHQQFKWVNRLRAEDANLYACLEIAVASGRRSYVLRLADGLWHYWELGPLLHQARSLLQAVLVESRPDDDAALRARALFAAGRLALRAGAFDDAERLFNESALLSRAIDQPRIVSLALSGVAYALTRKSGCDPARAATVADEALELASRIDDDWTIANAYNSISCVHYEAGDLVASEEAQRLSLAHFRVAGDSEGISNAHGNLGDIAYEQGQFEHARAHLDEALARAMRLDDRWTATGARALLATVLLHLGDASRARELALESLDEATKYGYADLARVAADALEEITTEMATRRETV